MKRSGLLAVLTALALTLGCAGPQRVVQDPLPATLRGPELASLAKLLPPLPDTRTASVAFVSEIDGRDTLSRSANAIDASTALNLFSATNAISWGIWQFTPDLHRPASVQAVMSIAAGNVVYIALADYSSGSWEIQGPFTAGVVLPLDAARHKSAGGHFCIAAICAGGDAATLHKLVLTADYEWQVETVDSAGNVGSYTSLAVVDGAPAISYCENLSSGSGKGLKFARASDATGTAWGEPQVLNDVFDEYAWTSLEVVNGNPAISFYTLLNVNPVGGGALLYIRANDATGSAWAATENVDNGYMLQDFVGTYNSLAVVNGHPAISYCGYALKELVYTRAQDPTGSTWDNRQWADLSEGGAAFTTLLVDNGLPLICYYDRFHTSLKGVGTNPEQTSWNLSFNIDDTAGDVGAYASAAIVGGAVAVAYYSDGLFIGEQLKYVRYDGLAEEWQSQVVTSSGNPGPHCSLAVIGGYPAISYYEWGDGDLWYVAALDSHGDAWGAPELVDSLGGVGIYTSLAEVDGKAAISYYDGTNCDLKFAIRLGP